MPESRRSSLLSRLGHWWRRLSRRERIEADFQDQIQLHIDQRASEYMASGLSRAEARRAALRRFGNVTLVREALHAEVRSTLLDAMRNHLSLLATDLRQVVRDVFVKRNLALAAVLTFAIGLGPGIAVFGLFDRLFLRPLPFDRPDELVQIHLFVNSDPRLPQAFLPQSYGDALASRSDLFSGVAWVNGASVVRTTPDEATGPLTLTAVTANAASVLGLRPLVGRLPDESDVDEPLLRSVLLTADAWRTRFGGTEDVLGRTWRGGPLSYRVVGVLPKDFLLPSSRLLEEIDGVFPFKVKRFAGPGALITAPFARLQHGVSIEQAEAATRDIAREPWESGDTAAQVRRITIQPLRSGMAILVGKHLALMFAAVAIAFCLTCLNLAALLHTWGRAEERTMALRVALGARPGDLLRLIGLKSALICTFGGTLAWLSYYLSSSMLVRLVPPELRGFAVQGTDSRLIAVTGAAALLATVVAAALPARSLLQIDLLTALERRRLTTRVGYWNPTRTLLAAEAALCVLLGVGAATSVPTFLRLLIDSTGFSARGLYVLNVNHGSSNSEDRNSIRLRTIRADAVAASLRLASGVEQVGVSEANPLEGQPDVGVFWQPRGLSGNVWTVDDTFFDALGVPLQAGRPFTNDESVASAPVAILNETAVRRLWPALPMAQAVGRTIHTSGNIRTIVGVVRDFRGHPGGEIAPGLFLPVGAQEFQVPQTSLSVLVRMSSPQSPTRGSVNAALETRFPKSGVAIESVENVLEPWLARPRLLALLFGFLAAISVLLVAVASYSLADFDVSRRLDELRIRSALGARQWHLRRIIVASGLPAVGAGTLAGSMVSVWLLDAYALAGLTESFGVETYLIVATLVCSLATFAALLPLRRLHQVKVSGVVRDVLPT